MGVGEALWRCYARALAVVYVVYLLLLRLRARIEPRDRRYAPILVDVALRWASISCRGGRSPGRRGLAGRAAAGAPEAAVVLVPLALAITVALALAAVLGFGVTALFGVEVLLSVTVEVALASAAGPAGGIRPTLAGWLATMLAHTGAVRWR